MWLYDFTELNIIMCILHTDSLKFKYLKNITILVVKYC